MDLQHELPLNPENLISVALGVFDDLAKPWDAVFATNLVLNKIRHVLARSLPVLLRDQLEWNLFA